MKLSRIALASVALFSSVSSFAGMVTSSPNIDFLAIDGQSAKKSLLKSQNSFSVNDTNPHQVVLRVSEIVKKGSDHTLFESAPIIVTFNGTPDNIMLSAPRIRDEYDVRRFEKNPHINVMTQSGEQVASKQDILALQGFMPGLTLIDTLSEYNASHKKAAVNGLVTTAVPAVVSSVAKASKGKITVQGQNIAEQQLQFWFQQADKATQERFLKWAAKH